MVSPPLAQWAWTPFLCQSRQWSENWWDCPTGPQGTARAAAIPVSGRGVLPWTLLLPAWCLLLSRTNKTLLRRTLQQPQGRKMEKKNPAHATVPQMFTWSISVHIKQWPIHKPLFQEQLWYKSQLSYSCQKAWLLLRKLKKWDSKKLGKNTPARTQCNAGTNQVAG